MYQNPKQSDTYGSASYASHNAPPPAYESVVPPPSYQYQPPPYPPGPNSHANHSNYQSGTNVHLPPQPGYGQGGYGHAGYNQGGYGHAGYNQGGYGSVGSSQAYVIPSYKRVMTDEFCNTCDDFPVCLATMVFPLCVAGVNFEQSNQGTCLQGCICHLCICGPSRSTIQTMMGVEDSGCIVNCCLHAFCTVCAITQEYRAIQLWRAEAQSQAVPDAIRM